MKMIKMSLLLLSLSSLTFAENDKLPSDVKAVISKRDTEIKKIDNIYQKSRKKIDSESVDKLMKLKAKYLKSQKVDSVVKIDKLITKLQTSYFCEEIVSKKWAWNHKDDKESWFILNPDGSGSLSGERDFKWEVVTDREIKLIFSKTSTASMKWNQSLTKYTGKDLDGRTKIYGEKI